MNRRTVPAGWMGAAFGGALVLAASVLALRGGGEKGIRAALDVTARWSFVLFWLAYSAAALGNLFRPVLRPLARRGRDFGLAFASAHLVHVGLIVWLGIVLDRIPLRGGLLVFFATAIFFTYLLAALSFGLADWLGPRLWRAIMFLTMNYILIAFARDFVLGAIKAQTAHLELRHLLDYSFFTALCIAAPLLCLAASARRRRDLRPFAI